MLHDAPASLPPYQRRLMVSGYLGRHHLTRGMGNFTSAGLDLGDRVIDVLLERADRLWLLDVQTHAPLLSDPWPREFAGAMSANFDCFHLSDDRFLWFDTNLAHIDALRERLGDGADACAVASTEGLYRPVAAPRTMIRDEFIFPISGLHIAARKDKLDEQWDRIVELTHVVAAAVGIPVLLVRRPAPAHYARDCMAALVPAPGGGLEPWMLAYELSDRFEDYLGVPGATVLEFGMSERVMSFCAHLQDGRAARFGSAVTPTQVFVEGDTDAPAELRAVPMPRDAVSRYGLAPVVANVGASSYRLLAEDYRRTYQLNGPLADVLAEHDRQLAAETTQRLVDYLAVHHSVSETAAQDTEGLIVSSPVDGHRGLYLNGSHRKA